MTSSSTPAQQHVAVSALDRRRICTSFFHFVVGCCCCCGPLIYCRMMYAICYRSCCRWSSQSVSLSCYGRATAACWWKFPGPPAIVITTCSIVRAAKRAAINGTSSTTAVLSLESRQERESLYSTQENNTGRREEVAPERSNLWKRGVLISRLSWHKSLPVSLRSQGLTFSV